MQYENVNGKITPTHVRVVSAETGKSRHLSLFVALNGPQMLDMGFVIEDPEYETFLKEGSRAKPHKLDLITTPAETEITHPVEVVNIEERPGIEDLTKKEAKTKKQ